MIRNTWEIIKFVVISLAIVLPIRFWVVQPFIVSGDSMVPSFANGDYLVVDEFSYHFQNPKRGEVVVLRFPARQFFIKRVIGLPGETVKIESGRVYIFSNKYPEGWLLEEDYTAGQETFPEMTVALAGGEYFVMGDNRLSSADSRSLGSAKDDFFVGRALLRLWPLPALSFWPGEAEALNSDI